LSPDRRAPWRGIRWLFPEAAGGIRGQPDDQGLQYLEMLRPASKPRHELIEALLGLSRLTRAEMRRQTVDLSALVRSIAANLRRSEPERQVEFVIADGLSSPGISLTFPEVMT